MQPILNSARVWFNVDSYSNKASNRNNFNAIAILKRIGEMNVIRNELELSNENPASILSLNSELIWINVWNDEGLYYA